MPARKSFRVVADHRAWSDPDHALIFCGTVDRSGIAIALVYLLIVMNFQSWLDPFIISYGIARRAGWDRPGSYS